MKIRARHMEYSEKVVFTKLTKLKRVSSIYMKDRSSVNFNRPRAYSDDFRYYLEIHKDKINRYYK